MNLTIIPFFLVAQLYPEVEKWKYGAEVNYQVHILSTVISDGDQELMGVDLNGDMGCRSKDIDTLVCRVTSVTIRDVESADNSNETDEPANGPIFEINFDENGVKSLTIEEPIRTDTLKMIRSFAAQMNVGMNIRRHVGLASSFVQNENFTLGECNTAFNVSWQEQEDSVSSEETSEAHDSSYGPNIVQRLLLDVPRKNGYVDLVIEKFRNPKRCADHDKYLIWLSRNGGDFNVISSFSRIALKENESFESSTVTTVKMKLRKASILHEFVKIQLRKITPATGPLPMVSRPATTGLSEGHSMETNFTE